MLKHSVKVKHLVRFHHGFPGCRNLLEQSLSIEMITGLKIKALAVENLCLILSQFTNYFVMCGRDGGCSLLFRDES